MKMTYKLKHLGSALIGLTVLALTACSHGPAVQEFPDTANAAEEVQKLYSDVHAALDNQANVLAPESFRQAQNSLDDAKASQDKSRDARVVLHSVAEGRAYLERANEATKAANTSMEEVVLARKQALDNGAVTLFRKDLKTADGNLVEVTSEIEKSDKSSVESKRRGLQTAYLDLELKSITKNALEPARATVEQAYKEGAKEHAVRTLAIAEKKIKDTDAFIVANRHAYDQIKARSADAKLSADHLLKITRESKTSKKSTGEDIALKIESGQNQVIDERAQTQDKQVQLEDKQVQLDAKQTQLEGKQAELVDEKNSVQVLAAQRNELESEKAFNQRFEEARAQFTDSEAEVYRQGNSLTIRLKGLEFPVAKAELRSSNYPLMAKVQRVIKSFGRSRVAIEGYTDSDGGKLMNEKLSAARAQSVSSYLVSTSTIDKADITSVGNGYQKPLASNKSSGGKAQNRRVDVIITPQS